MSFSRNPIASFVVVAVAVTLSGCSSARHDATSPQPGATGVAQLSKFRATSSADVAVVGDSQPALNRGIRSAKKAGKTPVFVTVAGAHRKYHFSPLAQLLRSEKGVIVRAYGKIFVFPKNDVHVVYSLGNQTVAFSELPQVPAPNIEYGLNRFRYMKKHNKLARQYSAKTVAFKQRICPDCAMVETNGAKFAHMATTWASASDPWQASVAQMVLWTPAVAGSSMPPSTQVASTTRSTRWVNPVCDSYGCYSSGYSGGGSSGWSGGSSGSGSSGFSSPSDFSDNYSDCSDTVGTGSSGYSCGTPPSQIACTGKPTDCKNVPCNGSPTTITDIVPSQIQNQGATQIVDINSLWDGGREAGWMYLGDNGQRYVQFNYADAASASAAFSAGFRQFGFSISNIPPSGYSGLTKWNGMLPPGTSLEKCETKGGTLVG